MAAFTGRRVLLAGVFLCLASACASTDGRGQDSEAVPGSPPIEEAAASETEPVERGPRPAPNPTSISVTLDDGAAVTEIIGPNGGSVTATLPGEGTATLTVPPGALLSDVAITMTPILSATGEVIGEPALVGVQLEPDGLGFLTLVDLEIAVPQITSEWAAVGSRGDGGDVHLTPSDATAGSSVIAVDHFSTWSIANSQVVEILEGHTPLVDQSYWEQELAAADLRGEGFSSNLDVFANWADDLEARLRVVTDEAGLEQGTGELIALLYRMERRLDAFTAEGNEFTVEQLEDRVDYSATLVTWLDEINELVQAARGACESNGPAPGFRILRWTTIVSVVEERSALLGADPGAEPWENSLLECLTFEVRWDVRVDHENTTRESRWAGAATAKAVLSASPYDAIVFVEQGLSPHPGFPAEVELLVRSWLEEDQLSAIDPAFGCTPVLVPGTVDLGLGIDVHIPNLGDLSTTRLEGFVVIVDPADAPDIRCEEFMEGRNRWATVAEWIRLDDENAGRNELGAGRFEVPADPTASPPGSYALLETENVIETSITGDAAFEIDQIIVIEHRPGATTGP